MFLLFYILSYLPMIILTSSQVEAGHRRMKTLNLHLKWEMR
jgi:hypothetical protein